MESQQGFERCSLDVHNTIELNSNQEDSRFIAQSYAGSHSPLPTSNLRFEAFEVKRWFYYFQQNDLQYVGSDTPTNKVLASQKVEVGRRSIRFLAGFIWIQH